MWPQAIIHTYAQYTYVHAQYSLIVWGPLNLTPTKTSAGNSQCRQRDYQADMQMIIIP